jgi:acetolactate synthase-1/2/3 large subunit
MPDLQKIAEAFELEFTRVVSPKSLDADLAGALSLSRPCIVDVQVATDEQLSPKAAAIPQKDGSMLSMPLEDMTPLLSLEQLAAEMVVPIMPQSRAARTTG